MKILKREKLQLKANTILTRKWVLHEKKRANTKEKDLKIEGKGSKY